MCLVPVGIGPVGLGIVIHALGLDARRQDPWRNCYVLDGEDPEMDRLVLDGLMRETRRPGFLDPGDRVFVATEEGSRHAVAENKRRNPPPTRDRARYLEWLGIRDVYPDATFGDWLRQRRYRRAS